MVGTNEKLPQKTHTENGCVSKSVVVQTYAAITLERWLSVLSVDYSKLVYAVPPLEAESGEVSSAQIYLATQLAVLCARRPGTYLSEVVTLQESAQRGLQHICEKAQVTLR